VDEAVDTEVLGAPIAPVTAPSVAATPSPATADRCRPEPYSHSSSRLVAVGPPLATYVSPSSVGVMVGPVDTGCAHATWA
jgi:hypothetical protein